MCIPCRAMNDGALRSSAVLGEAMLGEAVLGDVGTTPPRSIDQAPVEGYGRSKYGVGPYRGVMRVGEHVGDTPSDIPPDTSPDAPQDGAPVLFGTMTVPLDGPLRGSKETQGFGFGGPFGEAFSDAFEGTQNADDGRHSAGIIERLNAADVVDAEVIRGIWNRHGVDPTVVLENAELELKALLLLAAELKSQNNFNRGHNGPPELLSELDTQSLETALAAVLVVKDLVKHATVGSDAVLDLVEKALTAAAGAIARFAVWFAEGGKHYIHNVLEEGSKAFGASIGKTLGTSKGLAGLMVVIGGISNGQDRNVELALTLVKAVRAAALGQ